MSEETPKTKKKVVRAQSTPEPTTASKRATASAEKKKRAETEITWKATPEQKSKARNLRILAFVAWIAAIGLQFWVIFGLLQASPVNMVLTIAIIVAIGALAIAGNLMWRKSNRLDPASEKDKFRFFVQNQLGIFMTALAFIPMIVLILMNKDIDTKQKTILTAVAALMFGGAAFTGYEGNAASQEAYSQDKNLVLTLTGADEVFWTAGGSVYHLCEDVSDLQRDSETMTIEVGTIAQAQDAGKSRLTKKVESEAKQCGIEESVYVDAIAAWNEGNLASPSQESSTDPVDGTEDTTEPDTSDEPTVEPATDETSTEDSTED